MAEVLIDIDKISSQLATKLGPDIINEISKRQRGGGGGNGGGGGGDNSGGGKPKKKELTEKQKRLSSSYEGYQAGVEGNPLDQDSSELRSGRFAGIINRKIQSAKKLKDTGKEEWEKYKIKTGQADKDGSGSGDGSGHGLGSGSSSGNGRQKYNILEVKEARITNLHMKGGMGGSGTFGGGVSIPGRAGGSPGGAPSSDENVPSKTMGRLSAIVAPALMGVGALAGFLMSTISTMAGMNQQVKQAQEGTNAAYGGIAQGGGGLMRNPEVAQMSIARARVLGGEARQQNLDNSSSLIGAKFGLTQGIGGTAGAEMFAKMKKFGGFDGDENSLKKIMSDGVRSGFTGLRQSEFMQQVSGISENAYNSGMGIQSASQVSGTLSNLKGAGIRDNRLGSVYGAMNDNMTKEGGQMNSMLVAHHMQQNGGDYLAAMASAENGMNPENIGAIDKMTQGMDPRTKAIWMKKQGIMTAQEGQGWSQSGVTMSDFSKGTEVSGYGNEAGNKVLRYGSGVDEEGKPFNRGGQDQISHANKLDEMAVTAVFEKANTIQNKIFDGMLKMGNSLDAQYKKLQSGLSKIGIDI